MNKMGSGTFCLEDGDYEGETIYCRLPKGHRGRHQSVHSKLGEIAWNAIIETSKKIPTVKVKPHENLH